MNVSLLQPEVAMWSRSQTRIHDVLLGVFIAFGVMCLQVVWNNESVYMKQQAMMENTAGKWSSYI